MKFYKKITLFGCIMHGLYLYRWDRVRRVIGGLIGLREIILHLTWS